jgi:hypothetical protein
MASGGKNLRLGPFIGGLNTGSDPTAIADAELVTCRNMELDIDGSLVSRPPFVEIEGHSSFTERIVVLCEGVFSGVHYLIGSNINGVFYYLNGSWTLITNTFRASCAVQYANKIYLVPHVSSGSGGKWDPVGGFTAVAAIPKGAACAVHKERLFIVPGIAATSNETRIVFTDPGNFDVWPGSNFIDVGQGDGENLIDLTVYQDNLLLFKAASTYVLAYDVRPSDAVVRKVSDTIGVDSQNCVANYENQVYCLHDGWVYEIVNYDFNRLNTKVPFVNDQASPSPFSQESEFLGLVGDRLIVRFFARVYVYGLRTRTWSEWDSSRDATHYFGPIVGLHLSTGNEYYAGQCISAYRSLIKLVDLQNATDKERTLSPTFTVTDTFGTPASNGWGNADTGEVTTTTGGAASEYAVAAGVGTITHTSRNVLREVELNTTQSDFELYYETSIPVIATGDLIITDSRVRYVDSSNHYIIRINWGLAGAIAVQLIKVVAGAGTLLQANPPVSGNYAAGDKHSVRARFNGSTLLVKLWKTSTQEPVGWTLNVTDATFTTGKIRLTSILTTANTNALNVVNTFDNLQVGPLSGQVFDIACEVQTKNFDMAVPSSFKKLWWWGVDVITNRAITGTATPIVVSFAVTWAQLATKKWNQLLTWNQPLTAAIGVGSTVTAATGTSRRFIKFPKALRFRQINFNNMLLTDGSVADGPARLFTMTVITEVKEGVVKEIS